MRTGIVLAGGRSSRFGGDKLAADLGGRALLTGTIAALAGVVEGVVVAGPKLPPDWQQARVSPVALVRDTEPFAGPLSALANVLERAAPAPGDLAIVVGGDMPRLVPAVLQSMLDRLEATPRVDAVILATPDDRPNATLPRQVLPLAVDVERAQIAARTAVAAGRRSLSSLLEELAWIELPWTSWSTLDPSGETLLDVDTTADLERARGRNPAGTPSGA